MSTPAIETRALTKSYGSARGIEAVDLSVRPGEVFGFLGPNGAGKTTLIRTLLDLLRPTSGQARVFGLDSHLDSLAIRRRVAYLPGDLALFDRLTVAEHLDWLADLAGDTGARDRIGVLAERFQLDLSRRVRELSKGNRQKVGIVAVLARDAELLIMDEPTSGLDPVMQHEFHRVVSEVAGRGTTVFLSSHQLDEVQEVADRAGIIRDGRMVALEEVATLRDRGVRHLTVRFDSTPPADEFRSVPGVSDLSVKGTEISLRMEGRFGPLIETLARHDVVDLDSRTADLDEVFLAFYTDPDGTSPTGTSRTGTAGPSGTGTGPDVDDPSEANSRAGSGHSGSGSANRSAPEETL